jgi:hypothetical protein
MVAVKKAILLLPLWGFYKPPAAQVVVDYFHIFLMFERINKNRLRLSVYDLKYNSKD